MGQLEEKAKQILVNAPANSAIKKMTEAEIVKQLEKAEKYDKVAARTKKIGEKLRIKAAIYVMKAKAAGITVSDAEIDAEIKKRKKNKK